LTIGLDVGDRITHYCVLDDHRAVLDRGRCTTRRHELLAALSAFASSRVILEAGSQSPWMSAALRQAGFGVQVVDPRRVALIAKDPRKTDRRDAETLARLGAGCPELLGEVRHRDAQTQADLALLRARDLAVRSRARVIQHVRGLVKASGDRLPDTSARAFARRVAPLIPQPLQPAVQPLLVLLEQLERTIDEYDDQIERIAADRYPATAILQQIDSVGPVTSLAFVLTIADPRRFRSSRQVGSWIGLCPARHASGERDPQLPISKRGDGYLRRLLVQCAQRTLGPFGQDSDLRRFGLRLRDRGGAGSRKRAVIATARKLAVLLHHLWQTGEPYESLRQATRSAA
jgi:transposase